MATTPVPPQDGAPSRDNVRPGIVTAATGMKLFVGGLITIMGAAHLHGVLVTATSRGYAYDVRLAGLLLIGSPLVFGGRVMPLGGARPRPRSSNWLVARDERHHPAAPRLGAEHSLAAGRGARIVGPCRGEPHRSGGRGAWDPTLRICPWCGKQVAASRKLRCNHCGELLATRASPPQ